jgi:hypothetical protein
LPSCEPETREKEKKKDLGSMLSSPSGKKTKKREKRRRFGQYDSLT